MNKTFQKGIETERERILKIIDEMIAPRAMLPSDIVLFILPKSVYNIQIDALIDLKKRIKRK